MTITEISPDIHRFRAFGRSPTSRCGHPAAGSRGSSTRSCSIASSTGLPGRIFRARRRSGCRFRASSHRDDVSSERSLLLTSTPCRRMTSSPGRGAFASTPISSMGRRARGCPTRRCSRWAHRGTLDARAADRPLVAQTGTGSWTTAHPIQAISPARSTSWPAAAQTAECPRWQPRTSPSNQTATATSGASHRLLLNSRTFCESSGRRNSDASGIEAQTQRSCIGSPRREQQNSVTSSCRRPSLGSSATTSRSRSVQARARSRRWKCSRRFGARSSARSDHVAERRRARSMNRGAPASRSRGSRNSSTGSNSARVEIENSISDTPGLLDSLKCSMMSCAQRSTAISLGQPRHPVTMARHVPGRQPGARRSAPTLPRGLETTSPRSSPPPASPLPPAVPSPALATSSSRPAPIRAPPPRLRLPPRPPRTFA